MSALPPKTDMCSARGHSTLGQKTERSRGPPELGEGLRVGISKKGPRSAATGQQQRRATSPNGASLQRKIRLGSRENPDFLQACRLRTFIGGDGDRRPIADHITNAKVYFQQSAARNKPNTYVAE